MKTRSITKKENDFQLTIIDYQDELNIPEKYSVNIDFDDASQAWKANKKSIGNSSYKYICQFKTSSGSSCKRESLKSFDYCKIHNKIIEKKNKIEKKIKYCQGCFPIFQPNQLAHIGHNGCLGDEY